MALRDPFNRAVGYLRLSITAACPMRCLYCRPAVEGAPESNRLLSAGEIESLVRYLVTEHGLRKVRLTGGEPTVRPDLLHIVESLRNIDGLGEIAMTTNGLTLHRQAGQLAMAGLSRVNVSLDILEPDRFRRVTGVNGLHHVIAGIDSALEAGLTPVKLNVVVMRGENDEELPELLLFAADRGVELRFIELMPMGPLAAQWAERYVPESEIRERLSSIVSSWHRMPQHQAAAKPCQATLRNGRVVCVGFISAMSCSFCGECDRIRIAADGGVFPCLMDRPAGNVLAALRPVLNPPLLDMLLRHALEHKPRQHPMQGIVQMTRIGG